MVIILLINGSTDFLGEIPIRKSDSKDLYIMLTNNASNAEIVESRWSAFGRVDLVRFRDNDSVMFMFIDGAAGTPMFKFDGNIKNAYENLDFLKMVFSGNFPFYFLKEEEKDNMLIIGPGGGREIIIGLTYGIGKITGIEINKDFVDIVNEYKEYNGGVYSSFDNINIIVGEGRSYLQGDREKYDIIMLTQPFTKSSRSIEGYALTENYLLTVELIKDYLNHLTEEGRVIVVLHNTNEIMRFITASLEALKEMGVKNQEAMNHMYTVGREINPVIVLKKTPFSKREAIKRYYGMLYLKLNTPSAYIPHIEQKMIMDKREDGTFTEYNVLNDDLFAISQGTLTLNEFIKQSPFCIKPSTDDRPFFFKNEHGLPKNIKPLLIITMIVNFMIIVTSIIHGRAHKKVNNLMIMALLLGAGFMMIEISFFQKLILYVGSPILSLAVILSSLLVGMGIGSYYGTKFFPGQHSRRLAIFSFIICAVVIGLFHFLSYILYNLLSINILIKALISSFVLIPLGFILGIPFPTGLKLAEEIGEKNFVSWMYGINGTMAVLGSVATIGISNIAGFSISLFIGASFYLVIAVIFTAGKNT